MKNILSILSRLFVISAMCKPFALHAQENTNPAATETRDTAIFLAISSDAAATPTFVQTGNEAVDFVPPNWQLIFQATGDLNRDRRNDLVMVIANTDPANIIANEEMGSPEINSNPRYLLIAFQNKMGKYDLQALEPTSIPPAGTIDSPCLADPLEGVEIERGTLRLKFTYWLSCGSWFTSSTEYRFRYQHQKFELIRYAYSSFHRATGEMEEFSINYLTRKKKTSFNKNMFKDDTSKVTHQWETLAPRKLSTLNEIDLQSFSESQE